MKGIVQISIVSALILGVFGGFENVCKNTMPTCIRDEVRCLDPAYYFQCSRACGCTGSCLDSNAGCLDASTICIDKDERRRCPRFCGVCEGCNNLVHDDICGRNLHRCNEYNVKYLCAQTCGKCSESCRNKLASDNACDRFNQLGYCFSTSPYSYIMRDVCYASCSSGCRISHIP
uniref:ShKT domain-containing protein n=1 Tax=Lepeophtheirus salmonis TaxID=72036 RepID=A0A0K2TRX8_LEPSM